MSGDVVSGDSSTNLTKLCLSVQSEGRRFLRWRSWSISVKVLRRYRAFPASADHCVKTVSKPLLLGAFELWLSEKQMPQGCLVY